MSADSILHRLVEMRQEARRKGADGHLVTNEDLDAAIRALEVHPCRGALTQALDRLERVEQFRRGEIGTLPAVDAAITLLKTRIAQAGRAAPGSVDESLAGVTGVSRSPHWDAPRRRVVGPPPPPGWTWRGARMEERVRWDHGGVQGAGVMVGFATIQNGAEITVIPDGQAEPVVVPADAVWPESAIFGMDLSSGPDMSITIAVRDGVTVAVQEVAQEEVHDPENCPRSASGRYCSKCQFGGLGQ